MIALFVPTYFSADYIHRHGRPPLSEFSLLASANFALSLIPIRLAHRLAALRSLPFIVVSNPQISKIYNYYTHSLATLLPYSNRTIQTLEEEAQFTDVMADLVQTHANTIPILARGFLECRKYVSPETVTKFLDEHLRARIGTRLIAEQHIALHCSSQPHCPPQFSNDSSPTPVSHSAKQTQQQQLEDTHIGVIDTALAPANTIRHCESFVGELCELRYGVRPSVEINGNLDARIAYVPTHLEYILTELLKNAFRATVENGKEREPVEVTIAASSPSPSPSKANGSNNPDKSIEGGAITLRIRDRGGGIPPSVLPSVWAYSFTTFNEDEASSRSAHIPFSPASPASFTSKSTDRTFAALNMLSQTAGGAGGGGGVGGQSSLAGLGYGLPLGRAYAEHFGGGIEMESLWGWGTDVYLRVKGLDGF